jgi:hypothetical protein
MRRFAWLFFLFLFPPCGMALAQISNTSFRLFFEKVYLHTDRETYAGNEDIWFKAYLVNGQTNVLTTTSNNLYVELISPGARIISHKLIRLDNGLGKGDFHLEDSLPAGTYRLRAYTSWMRNFGDNFIFEKSIRVISTSEPAERSTLSKTNMTTDPSPASQTTLPAPVLRFFPEGGSLIDGVAGMLAFKVENNTAKGLGARGTIVSSSGTLVTEFTADSSGMGSMFLNAVPGEKYTAKGTFSNGTTFTVPLPNALSQGFSLFIRNTDSLCRVIISTNTVTYDQQKERLIKLIGRNKGRVVYAIETPLSSLQLALNIPKQDLPMGVVAFTL